MPCRLNLPLFRQAHPTGASDALRGGSTFWRQKHVMTEYLRLYARLSRAFRTAAALHGVAQPPGKNGLATEPSQRSQNPPSDDLFMRMALDEAQKVRSVTQFSVDHTRLEPSD